MLAVLYLDKNDRTGYDIILDDMTADEWLKSARAVNIGAKTVKYIFDMNDEILSSERTEQEVFNKYYEKYGFDPDMLGKRLVDIDGTVWRFVGFIPQNRKYKCRVKDVLSGIERKATLDSVYRMLTKHPAK